MIIPRLNYHFSLIFLCIYICVLPLSLPWPASRFARYYFMPCKLIHYIPGIWAIFMFHVHFSEYVLSIFHVYSHRRGWQKTSWDKTFF